MYLSGCYFVVTNAVLPAGFEDEGVVRIPGAVDITFLTNNDDVSMLTVTKEGLVYTYDLTTNNAKGVVALDLTKRICSNGERGYVL